MRASKKISSMPEFRFRPKKTKEIIPENTSMHPRFELKINGGLGDNKSNSLLFFMYDQDNEILFI